MKRSPAFTLIEVMVAVAVLALSTTAAIKLVVMAQNTLSAVKEKEALLDTASEIEALVTVKELSDSGTSKDLVWETSDKETEMFGEDFGRLNFGAASGEAQEKPKNLKWRELTVKNNKESKITLYMPSKEQEEAKEVGEAAASEAAVSGDKRQNEGAKDDGAAKNGRTNQKQSQN
ncbi:MAG: prepilin-type N-terminal cleavage/methylation domain-containing protein [Cloacibacillus sp.]